MVADFGDVERAAHAAAARSIRLCSGAPLCVVHVSWISQAAVPGVGFPRFPFSRGCAPLIVVFTGIRDVC